MTLGRSVLLLVAAACLSACNGSDEAAPTSGNPSQVSQPSASAGPPVSTPPAVPGSSTTYRVKSFRRGNEELPLLQWREVRLSEPLEGGRIVPVGVCNTPSVVVDAVKGDQWTVSPSTDMLLVGCLDEAKAQQTAVKELLQGTITAQQRGPELVLTRGQYTLILTTQ